MGGGTAGAGGQGPGWGGGVRCGPAGAWGRSTAKRAPLCQSSGKTEL